MSEPSDEPTERPRRRVKAAIAALLICVLVAAAVVPLAWSNRDPSLPIPGPAPVADPLRLVALGDSYTAGPGVLPYQAGTAESGCFRSDEAYPVRAGRSLGADTLSVACSGATTAALTSSYLGQPPQLDAVEGADVVVLSLGGNDVRALQTLAEDPLAAVGPTFIADFERLQLAPLATTLDNAYGAIRARLDADARVFVVGYPNLFPAQRAAFQYCAGFQLPLGPAAFNIPLENLHLINARLNDTIQAAAERAGFVFVDMEPWFDERDVCSEQRLIWGSVDAPTPEGAAHPTGDGHRVMGDVVAGVIEAQLPIGSQS